MSGKEIELINKGYDKDLVLKLCSYTNDELNICVNKAIELLTNNVVSVNSPKCIFIGGQPGVGKSVLSDKLKKRSNSVEISMDACRSFHPHYKEIEDTIKNFYKDKVLSEEINPGHDIAAFTQYFAGNMANCLIDKMSSMNYNIILEWNMRNSKDVLECMNMLSNKGYKNEALVLTIDKDKSYEASQIRADVMDSSGLISRRVNKNFHTICIETIPSNVDIIYKIGKDSNILDNMKVILRDGKIVWNSEIDKNLPSAIINEYYNNKELSSNFINNPKWAYVTIEKESLGLRFNYKKNNELNGRKMVA